MNNFTFEETNLLCIYNTGSRTGLIDALTEMRGELSPEEGPCPAGNCGCQERTAFGAGQLEAPGATP